MPGGPDEVVSGSLRETGRPVPRGSLGASRRALAETVALFRPAAISPESDSDVASADLPWEQLLRDVDELPTDPNVAMSIVEAIGSGEQPAISVLVAYLHSDPAVAGKILRLANSTLFGKPRRISTMTHAVALLDPHVARLAALSFAFSPLVGHIDGFDYRDYWRRSWAMSLSAERIAGHFPEVNVEEARLAGLLSDVGRLVLVEILGQRYGNLCRDAWQPGQRIEAREREELGIDHLAVAGQLFRRWSFPESMVQAIESHRDVEAIEELDEHSRELAKVLFLSVFLCDLVLFYAQPGEVLVRFHQWARMEEPAVSAIADEVSAELAARQQMYHVSEHSIEEVRNRARRALFAASLQSVSMTTRQAEESRRRAEEFRIECDHLKKQVTLDPILNIGNRRYFDARLLEEHKRGLRTGRPLSLILFDLDHFKSLNDNYGHQLGDEVLRAATRTIGQCLRSSDVFARYGGEEFAVICPETEFAGAVSLADRMRQCLERLEILQRGRSVRVTASFGVTTVEQLQDIHSVESLVEAADLWLFEAKRAGRNCVRGALFSTPDSSSPATMNPWDAGALAPTESGSGAGSGDL